MNLSLIQTSKLNTEPILYKKTNFILYTIEKGATPYIYFHMIKNANNIITVPTIYLNKMHDLTKFIDTHFTKYSHIGTFLFNDENFVFYEIILDNLGFLPTYESDSWWKVTPYEIIYTQTVLIYAIDQYYIDFFKKNPDILYIFKGALKYETPIVGYIGIDSSELNQQILLNDLNYKDGTKNKSGYYFGIIEQAYFQSLYTDLSPTEDLIKLINDNYIREMTPSKNNEITIKHDKFYLNNSYIGEVPQYCNNRTFTLYQFNENFIYLKSDKKLKKCKTQDFYIKRKNSGCMIRYVLFLKKTSITYKLKTGYDSFCYGKVSPTWFPTYMVRNLDQMSALSYHWSVDNDLDPEYITKKDKDMLIKIKLK